MPYSHPQEVDRHSAFRRVRYLLPGAVALAVLAGYVNSVGLGFFRTPVSHMTGAVSHFGMDTADGRWRDSFATAAIILGFILGAGLSGWIVGARKLVPGRHYGMALVAEGVLLGIATLLLLREHRAALPVMSMACGLQNAMSSSYCGLAIRTTHVTGLVTDFGVMLGHWLRHGEIERWKLALFAALAGAFGVGCWAGQLVDTRIGPLSLALPAAGCVVAGAILWVVYHHRLADLVMQPAADPRRDEK